MRKVTFKPPYRVGRKSGTTVLDSNGIEVVNFRDEGKAKEYVEYLNKKHRHETFQKALSTAMFEKYDFTLTIHKPRKFDYIGAGKPSKFLMDEIGQWQYPLKMREPVVKTIPWYIVDHVSRVVEYPINLDKAEEFREQCAKLAKHYDAKLLIKEKEIPSDSEIRLSKDMMETWRKVVDQSKDREPCCDENNPCACATFSPNMASPEDVREFLESRKVRYQPTVGIKSKIMMKLNQILKKYKQ